MKKNTALLITVFENHSKKSHFTISAKFTLEFWLFELLGKIEIHMRHFWSFSNTVHASCQKATSFCFSLLLNFVGSSQFFSIGIRKEKWDLRSMVKRGIFGNFQSVQDLTVAVEVLSRVALLALGQLQSRPKLSTRTHMMVVRLLTSFSGTTVIPRLVRAARLD